MRNEPRIPDPRELKLPSWVQFTLEALRRELANAERAAEEARLATSPDESNAVIHRFESGDIGLGNETVTFKLGHLGNEHSWRQEISVRVRMDIHRLVINGSEGILLHPAASNAIEISMPD